MFLSIFKIKWERLSILNSIIITICLLQKFFKKNNFKKIFKLFNEFDSLKITNEKYLKKFSTKIIFFFIGYSVKNKN